MQCNSLSIGIQTVPQVFLNDKCIGGFKQLEELDKQGQLDAMIKECLASVDSPLLLRTPLVTELIEVYKIHNNYCSDLRCSKYIRVLCPSNNNYANTLGRVRNSKNQCQLIQVFSGAIDSPKW